MNEQPLPQLLSDFDGIIGRGRILRCPAKAPYEDVVDIMLVQSYHDTNGWSLVVSSGRQAGRRLNTLPLEASPLGERENGIAAAWLRDYWYRWGYNPAPVDQVWVVEAAVPTLPPAA